MATKSLISKLGGTRQASEGLAVNGSPTWMSSVIFDAKNGEATVRFTRPAANSRAEFELSAERVIFLAHYIRARRAFSSDVQMAEMLGVDRTRLIAWKKGSSTPRRENVRYLADVATTVDALVRFLHPSVVADWLTAPKFQFADRTPVDMLREGCLPEVLLAVNATEHGAY